MTGYYIPLIHTVPGKECVEDYNVYTRVGVSNVSYRIIKVYAQLYCKIL